MSSSQNDKTHTGLDDVVDNAGTTPGYSELADYSNSPDPYDEIVKSMTHVRKEANKKHKTRDFLGVLLDYDEITVAQCITETHTGFVDFIDDKLRGKMQTDSDLENISCYRLKVYIPELESYLPNLSIKEITEYHMIKHQIEGNIDITGQQKEDYDFCRRRVHRFKTFYTIQDQSPTLRKGIKVRFIDDNFFYGVAVSKQ